MTRTRRLAVSRFILPAWLSLWALAPEVPAAQAAPVSWVNPKLPDGPGLTHRILDSKAMEREVGYVVWTPRDFDASGRTRYPVVYFLHGMGGNESADAAGFSDLVGRGIRDGILPPMLCVFPNGGRSGYRGNVEKMILEELIPLIDSTYPTRAQANARGVAGFSMGGSGAVRFWILHPELFCVAGSWGGGMGRESDALLAAVDRNVEALRQRPHGVFLVNGEQDRPEAFRPLAEKLRALNIDQEMVVLPETPHNLGLYYQRAGTNMIRFLGRRLMKPGPGGG